MTSELTESAAHLNMSTSVSGVSPAGQPPVIIMVPATSASSKPDYSRIFPKNVVVGLGAIQLIIAAIAITSQIIAIHWYYAGIAFIGTGAWCGFVFGISGGFALWAGLRPSLCSIITCMVFSIIAACFCVPLIVLDSFSIIHNVDRFDYSSPYRSTSRYSYGRHRREYYEINIAMYSIQVIMGLVQACIAIGCSAMACKATCCRQKEAGTVYYKPNDASNANVQHIQMGQVHPGGFITIPINQNTTGILSETVPMSAPPEVTKENLEKMQSPPPQYEDYAKLSSDDASANGLNYQRFV